MRADQHLADLLARWHAAPPPPAAPGDVERILVEEFRAYRIPLDTNSVDDFENDEEVRADLLDSLWTITHPDVLDSLRNPEATTLSGDEVDEYWRDIFVDDPDDPTYTLSYRLLVTQHGIGQRVSVVLEREGEHVTGFKAYGWHSGPVEARLRPVIGFPARRPQDHPDAPTMVPGDLDDPLFVEYLESLARAGVI